jgi:hypothetical protein
MLPLSKVKKFNYAFQNNNFQINTIHNIPIRIGPLFDDIKCNTNVMKITFSSSLILKKFQNYMPTYG